MKAHDAPRVEITKDIRDRLFAGDLKGEVSDLSAHTGLPYGLIYNLVRGRIRSLSIAEYRRIFGEAPPVQEQKRVNAEYFRGMVRLWTFLNQGITEKDLYREFYLGRRSLKKADYRIFNGATKTVEGRLERTMEQKFLNQGLDRPQVIRWIQELEQGAWKERVPYEEARPALAFLQDTLGIHPTRLLRRRLGLYKKGLLKSILRDRYEEVLTLKGQTEKALAAGSGLELERLREGVYGKRKNLVLFREAEEDLKFLQRWAGASSKKYLGRSAGKYRRLLLKRIASWRAEKIRADCDRAVAENRNVPLRALPARHFAAITGTLMSALGGLLVHRMIADKSLNLERLVMSPQYHSKEEYGSGGYGYVTLRDAANFLGMKQRAFDLLVAAHRDVFMRIMEYDKGWLIPELYLEEVSQHKEFSLVKAKYELLARKTLEAKKVFQTRGPEKTGPRQGRLRAGSAKHPFGHDGSGQSPLLINPEGDAGVSLARCQTTHSPGSHLDAWS